MRERERIIKTRVECIYISICKKYQNITVNCEISGEYCELNINFVFKHF